MQPQRPAQCPGTCPGTCPGPFRGRRPRRRTAEPRPRGTGGMFERIVVAVDGSPQSSKTIPVAVDLAKRYGSMVTVVHVREQERYEGSEVDLGPPIPADVLVNDTVAMFREAGIEARSEIRRVR